MAMKIPCFCKQCGEPMVKEKSLFNRRPSVSLAEILNAPGSLSDSSDQDYYIVHIKGAKLGLCDQCYQKLPLCKGCPRKKSEDEADDPCLG